MKIAIAAEKNNINSFIDAHFGRCNWFCIFDTKSQSIEFIENERNESTQYAGHEVAILLAGMNINVVIAGRFGAKAVQLFRNKNIQMIIPEKRLTINKIIDKIKL